MVGLTTKKSDTVAGQRRTRTGLPPARLFIKAPAPKRDSLGKIGVAHPVRAGMGCTDRIAYPLSTRRLGPRCFKEIAGQFRVSSVLGGMLRLEDQVGASAHRAEAAMMDGFFHVRRR